MIRRRLVMLAGLAALLLVIAVEAQGANDVATVNNVGWWTKRPAAQPISGPTSFEVASGPDGDESVAALRILISGTVTKATLRLTEVANMGTAVVSVPKIQVCPTDTPWALTTNPGAFADAPKPSCGTASPLARDATGNWSADVTTMLAGNRSEVSLMVVPAPDTTLPIPPTFIVDIATSRVETEGTPDVAPKTAPPTTEVAPVAPVPGRSGTTPSAPPPITSIGPVATPVAPATTTPLAVVPARLGGERVASTSKPKPWGKLLVLLPLSAIAGFGWVAGRKYAAERGLIPTAS